MPVYSFLDSYDLSGKTVYLAVTHGGSRLSGTDREIAKAEPKAMIDKNPLVLSRDSVAKSEKQIIDWAKKLGLKSTTPTRASGYVVLIRGRAVGFNTLRYDASVGVLNPRIIKS